MVGQFVGWLVCALASIGWLVPVQCVSAQSVSPASAAPTTVTSDSASLHVGDIIRLKIWREPDLSGDFTIPTDGNVVFPKIGVYAVLGETPSSLRVRLVKDYSQSLVNPSIDVVVLYRVNVLGAVRNPGLYTPDATMTVPDVIALAGGVTPDGDDRHVQLLRGGAVVATQVDQHKPIARNFIQSGDQLYVPQTSWLSRNSGVVGAAMITASAYLLTTLLIHR